VSHIWVSFAFILVLPASDDASCGEQVFTLIGNAVSFSIDAAFHCT
jgi:hypothetical protein